MEVKGEANLFKVEKIAEKVVFGVDKESRVINIYYVDNKQISYNVTLPKEVEKIDQKTIESRVKKIIEDHLGSYKHELMEKLSKDICKLTEEALATSMTATACATVANNPVYLTTGNAIDIKII